MKNLGLHSRPTGQKLGWWGSAIYFPPSLLGDSTCTLKFQNHYIREKEAKDKKGKLRF